MARAKACACPCVGVRLTQLWGQGPQVVVAADTGKTPAATATMQIGSEWGVMDAGGGVLERGPQTCIQITYRLMSL